MELKKKELKIILESLYKNKESSTEFEKIKDIKDLMERMDLELNWMRSPYNFKETI